MTRDETRDLLADLLNALEEDETQAELEATDDSLEQEMAIIMGVQAAVFAEHGFADYAEGMMKLGEAMTKYGDDEEIADLATQLETFMDQY